MMNLKSLFFLLCFSLFLFLILILLIILIVTRFFVTIKWILWNIVDLKWDLRENKRKLEIENSFLQLSYSKNWLEKKWKSILI